MDEQCYKIHDYDDGAKNARLDYRDASYVELVAYPDDYNPENEFSKKYAATIRKQYYPRDQIFEKENTSVLQCAVGPKNAHGDWRTSGFTVEEMLLAAHLRLALFQDKFPCDENAAAIEHIRQAVALMDARRKDRAERGVLSKNKA